MALIWSCLFVYVFIAAFVLQRQKLTGCKRNDVAHKAENTYLVTENICKAITEKKRQRKKKEQYMNNK